MLSLMSMEHEILGRGIVANKEVWERRSHTFLRNDFACKTCDVINDFACKKCRVVNFS